MLNQNLLDNTLHISKGSFKLEKINNISTNTLTNEYCKKQYKKKIHLDLKAKKAI